MIRDIFFTGSISAQSISLELLSFALKAALILLFAGCVVLALRRISAAGRHFVWLSGLASLLVLPIGSLLLPELNILPRLFEVSEASDSVGLEREIKPAESVAYEFPAAETETAIPRPDLGSVDVAEKPLELESSTPVRVPIVPAPEVTDAQALESVSEPNPVGVESVGSSTAIEEPFQLQFDSRWLLGLWILGTIILFLRLVLATVSLWRRSIRAERVESGLLFEQAEDLCEELGLKFRVNIKLGCSGVMPMVWGIFSRHLLLPAEALHWSPSQLRPVILHELAHLRRRDPLGLLIGQLAATLHWPNPLAWVALGRLRAEAERACDDVVLQNGVRPSDYATEMLRCTLGLHSTAPPLTGLMMARLNGIELRISRILDNRRNRRSMARGSVLALGFTAVAAFVPIAMLDAESVEGIAAEKAGEPSDEVKSTPDEPIQIDHSYLFGSPALRHVKEPEFHTRFLELGRKDARAGDFDSLVDRVNAVKVVVLRQAAAEGAVRGAGEVDVQKALDLIPRFHIRDHFRQRAEAQVLEDLLDRDVKAVAHLLTERPVGGQIRGRLIDGILRKLPGEELEKNLAWARKFDVSHEEYNARRGAFLIYAQAQPEKVVDRLKQLKEPGDDLNLWDSTQLNDRILILETAYKALEAAESGSGKKWLDGLAVEDELPKEWVVAVKMGSSPVEDLKFAMALPEGSVRRVDLLKKLIPELAQSDVDQALKLTLHIPNEDRVRIAERILKNWAERDLDAALKFCDENPRVVHGSQVVPVFSILGKRDIAGAEEALRRAQKISVRTGRNMIIFTALGAMVAAGEPERAMEIGIELGGTGWVRNVAYDWSTQDGEGLQRWLAIAPLEQRVPALAGLASAQAYPDFRAAAASIDLLAGLELPQRVIYDLQGTSSAVALRLAEADVEIARKWVKGIAEQPFAGPASRALMKYWWKSDQEAAVEWMLGLPPGRGREGAAVALLESMANYKGGTHIPRSIEDGPASPRRDATLFEKLEKLITGLELKDHDEARAALGVLEMEDAERARLLNLLDKENTE